MLLAAEWGDARHRGFIASLPQCGIPIGLLLANGALALAAHVSGAAFADWGWRIPFLASLVLVAVGLAIRLRIAETPAFARVRDEGRIARAPVLDALRANGGAIALIALLRTGEQSSFYLFTTFVLSYATGTLGFERGPVLRDVMIAAAVSTIAIPAFGALADRVGRRRLLAIGIAAMVVWPFVWFRLLDARSAPLALLAIVGAALVHDVQFAPQAAVITECFPGPVRYSGVSLGFQLASITAGGPTPFIALWLLQRTGSSTAIAAWLSAASLVSLAALARLVRQPAFDVER